MSQTIKITKKKLFTLLGIVGSTFSVIGFFTSQQFNQTSYGPNSPIIHSNGSVKVDIDSTPRGKDWFDELEKDRPNISKEQFLSLKKGMTYEEVVALVKMEGVVQSQAEFGSNYAWGNYPFHYMHASFDKNNKLEYAVNSGLF
jgi:hypothetical protein